MGTTFWTGGTDRNTCGYNILESYDRVKRSLDRLWYRRHDEHGKNSMFVNCGNGEHESGCFHIDLDGPVWMRQLFDER